MNDCKVGMIDIKFPVIQNLCEIITIYANVIDKLALKVDIDTKNKKIELKPYVQGEDEMPAGTLNISAFGKDIYQSPMPQEALFVYFYMAVDMFVREKEKDDK